MKIIAINEIHVTDKKSGKPVVIRPGATFDIPQAEAELLLKGALPPARRMTEAEIELDKLRAGAIAAGKSGQTASADAENGDDNDDNDDDDDDDDEPAKPAARAAAKPVAAKGKTGGY